MIPTIARHGGAVNPAPVVDRTASRPGRWTVQIARLSRGPGSGTVAGHVLAWSRHGKESDTSVGRKDAAAKVLDTLGEPIRRNRIYEDVMERIQRLVADGHMQPGDRLPSERDLSAALHVSRGSVRQALRILEQTGMIEARVGGGTYIRTPDPRTLVQQMALVLAQHPQTLRQLFEVRRVLEPALAHMAAERATPADLAVMGAILDQQAECIATGQDIKKTDIDFHYAVNAASNNEIALRLVDMINDLLRGGAPDIGREEDPSVWLAEHRRIYEAVARREGRAAEKAVRAHLDHLARLAPLEEPVIEAQ